jgi:hypothetical protein
MIKRILVLLTAAATLSSADTLVLRNGNRVEGNYVGGDSRSLRFAIGNRVNNYSLNEIESIHFTGGPQGYAPATEYPQGQAYPQNPNYGPRDGNYPPPNGTYSQSSNYPPPGPNGQGSYQNRPPDNYPPPVNSPQGNGPVGLEVPAGTEIVVRLIDPVDSERDRLGQTYRASIDQPVVVNGQTVIPRGSDTVATLIAARQSGKIEGRTVLTLDLKDVAVNGRNYDIVTTGVSQTSGSRGERSAKVIGGTAALGTIIGAIAGGGKGAAIGAGSGAAVGTVAEVATSGQKVKVPAETRLTFTLQSPLDM